jgi:hypothetical protein
MPTYYTRWEFFCDKKFNLAAAKLEVVSNLEINSIPEKFRRILPILLNIYVAEIIAEHVIHKGNCEIQNGRLETGSNDNF